MSQAVHLIKTGHQNHPSHLFFILIPSIVFVLVIAYYLLNVKENPSGMYTENNSGFSQTDELDK